ncbi:MAG: PilZ domain-containing protein [Spirochaetales bacterium]|nr:PilZ domain-containing protein [Spirochaetales bacterium]
MKTIIFTRNESLVQNLSYHLLPLSFEIVHESDTSRLFDLLKEEYDLIVFDIADFPRHWKPIVKLLRDDKSKEQTIVVLINANQFPFEEAAKAIYLGVNGIIDYDANDKREIYRLMEIFKRYRSVKENRRFMRVIPEQDEVFQILFTNPHTGTIVTGRVVDVSIQGIMFTPLEPSMASGLEDGDTIPHCSLQIGEHVISLECKISRAGGSVGMEFTYFNEDAHHRLFTYLMERPFRKLRQQVERPAARGEE